MLEVVSTRRNIKELCYKYYIDKADDCSNNISIDLCLGGRFSGDNRVFEGLSSRNFNFTT